MIPYPDANGFEETVPQTFLPVNSGVTDENFELFDESNRWTREKWKLSSLDDVMSVKLFSDEEMSGSLVSMTTVSPSRSTLAEQNTILDFSNQCQNLDAGISPFIVTPVLSRDHTPIDLFVKEECSVEVNENQEAHATHTAQQSNEGSYGSRSTRSMSEDFSSSSEFDDIRSPTQDYASQDYSSQDYESQHFESHCSSGSPSKSERAERQQRDTRGRFLPKEKPSTGRTNKLKSKWGKRKQKRKRISSTRPFGPTLFEMASDIPPKSQISVYVKHGSKRKRGDLDHNTSALDDSSLQHDSKELEDLSWSQQRIKRSRSSTFDRRYDSCRDAMLTDCNLSHNIRNVKKESMMRGVENSSESLSYYFD